MDIDSTAVIRNLQMQIADQALRIAILETQLGVALTASPDDAPVPVDVAPGE